MNPSYRAARSFRAALLAAGGIVGAAPGFIGVAHAQPATVSVPNYILRRLSQHGVKHLFGIPAATSDALFRAAMTSDVAPVITSSDLDAGYAADGYARLKGLSAVCVARGVGTLSLANAIASAFTERSPVVLINGGPSPAELTAERTTGLRYSHSTGPRTSDPGDTESADLAVFRQLTAYAERVTLQEDVPNIVDGAISEALKTKRPVYIEIARGVWIGTCRLRTNSLQPAPFVSGNEEDLAKRTLTKLYAARRPALLLGIELQRYKLAAKAEQLVRALQARYATTKLAKSVISEDTPGFSGVHGGLNSPASVRAAIDNSDALLTLGCIYGTQQGPMVTAVRRGTHPGGRGAGVGAGRGGARRQSRNLPRPAACRACLRLSPPSAHLHRHASRGPHPPAARRARPHL